jgi:hypothetical protein
MPSRYPADVRRQVVELARSGTSVVQLAETFGMTQATIYNWLKQDRNDRGEAPGPEHRGANGARGREETHPAARDGTGGLAEGPRGLSRAETCPQKPLPGDLIPDRAGIRRSEGLFDAGCLSLGLLRVEGASAVREDAHGVHLGFLSGEITWERVRWGRVPPRSWPCARDHVGRLEVLLREVVAADGRS